MSEAPAPEGIVAAMPPTPKPPWLKAMWDSTDIKKLLSLAVFGAYIALLFLGKTPDETLKNVLLLIAGYLWGSSDGSRRKDEERFALLKPPPGSA